MTARLNDPSILKFLIRIWPTLPTTHDANCNYDYDGKNDDNDQRYCSPCNKKHQNLSKMIISWLTLLYFLVNLLWLHGKDVTKYYKDRHHVANLVGPTWARLWVDETIVGPTAAQVATWEWMQTISMTLNVFIGHRLLSLPYNNLA